MTEIDVMARIYDYYDNYNIAATKYHPWTDINNLIVNVNKSLLQTSDSGCYSNGGYVDSETGKLTNSNFKINFSPSFIKFSFFLQYPW